MYRIFLTAIAALILTASGYAQYDADSVWKEMYPQLEKQIKVPVFKAASYNIAEYGGVSGDPEFLNDKVINSTIDLCSSKGGGQVIVPRGTWHTGPLVLKSNVNLIVEEGAVLLFTSDTAMYPSVLTRWEGMDCYNVSPMIYAFGQENVAISGKGIIDGGASRENWWGLPRLNAVPGKPLRGRALLMDWNEKGTPIERRKMFANDNLRPQLINLYKCKGILIEDVTLNRPAFWTIHPLLCENLTVRGVTINTSGAPNGDGCDPESCKNVLIEDCYFNTGDDCIAIKSGRNGDGRRWSIPSENIIVRNCKMKNGHGGVVIGSEISGGYRNLFVDNCEMDSPSLDRVIRIKTNNCRGGVIENIFVRNVTVGQCREAVLLIDLTYESSENCRRDFPPFVKNVYLDNVKSGQSRYGAFITGFKDITNISNINVLNCEWTNVKESNRVIGLVEGLNFQNTTINGTPVKN
ncbi:MAG: glycoside hydrolase family 28 protein [Bacteroidales bacterium]|jgi:polygalacturonase|nr:glycoside hydrolase family 28 protein [Bacteroidales bacterium]